MRFWKAAILIALLCAACSERWAARRSEVRPVYDSSSGRLTQLGHDSNRNGIIDTWTDMDGARPIAARADRNEDGRVDRWEYYDGGGRLVKVGFSRADDGRPDAWAFSGADGTLARVDVSSSGDEHRIDRWEFYESAGGSAAPALVRAEEDTSGDGRVDKWETYTSGELATIAWDVNGDGLPDRRLTYRDAALALIESKPDATGRFTERVIVR